MGKSKDLATGETRFVNTTGDSMVNDGEVLKLSRTSGASENLIFSTQAAAGISTTTYVGQIESAGNNALEVFTTGSAPVHIGTNNAVRMTVDGSGRVTMPYQPAFKASIQTTTGRSTTNTTTITPYDTAQLNIGNHYNTSTYKFTAPVAGNYFFSLTQNKVGRLIIYFVKNTTNFHAGEFLQDSAGSWEHCTISCVIPLAANDTVNAAYNLSNNNSTQYAWNGGSTLWDSFSGFLIG